MKKSVFTFVTILLLSLNLFAQDPSKKVNLNDYSGVFVTEDAHLGTVTVRVEKEKLLAVIGTGEEFVLEYVKGDEFSIPSAPVTVVFTRDEKKNVSGFVSTDPSGSQTIGKKAVQETGGLKDYVGEYYAEGKEEALVVTEENGKLFASAGDQKFELTKVKGDDFEIKEVPVGVSFTRNKDKKVDGIKVINPDGNEQVGKKAEKK